MARTSNLTDFLTDVSSAIKQKTGDSAPIPASEFDTEILSIETAGNYQSKTLNITQNGNYNLLPDQEFDAISNVNISVSVSPVLQNKTITENGSYTADQNYDGLGTVIVNVPQTGDVPVKLFETQEAMQADPDAKEGDLAVVYRSEIQNATVDSKFQKATFPETVVLDTAITDYVEVRYRAVDNSVMFDCWGQLDSNMFMMDCYTESGSIRIVYESSDSITYTRTRMQGDSGNLENPVDFGTEIYYYRPEYWNDVIGKFIQVGGSTFEGLFNYSPIISDEIVTFGSVKYKLPKAIINYSETVDFNNKINGLMFRTDSYVNNRANSIMKVNNYEEINGIRCVKSGSLYFIMAGYPLTAIITATNETRIAFTGYTGGTSSGNTTYVRKVDFDENGITNTTDYPTEQLTANFEALSVKGQTYYWDISVADDTAMKTYVSGINGDTVTIPQRGSSTVTLSYVSGNEYTPPVFNTNVLKWLYATTQLTLSDANQLLPGKIAYGKNGVVEGDGSIYDNLDMKKLSNTIFDNIKYSNNILSSSITCDISTLINMSKFTECTDTITNITNFKYINNDTGIAIYPNSSNTRYYRISSDGKSFSIYNTDTNEELCNIPVIMNTLNADFSRTGQMYYNNDYLYYVDIGGMKKININTLEITNLFNSSYDVSMSCTIKLDNHTIACSMFCNGSAHVYTKILDMNTDTITSFVDDTVPLKSGETYNKVTFYVMDNKLYNVVYYRYTNNVLHTVLYCFDRLNNINNGKLFDIVYNPRYSMNAINCWAIPYKNGFVGYVGYDKPGYFDITNKTAVNNGASLYLSINNNEPVYIQSSYVKYVGYNTLIIGYNGINYIVDDYVIDEANSKITFNSTNSFKHTSYLMYNDKQHTIRLTSDNIDFNDEKTEMYSYICNTNILCADKVISFAVKNVPDNSQYDYIMINTAPYIFANTLDTISPTEYNTAIDTANEILGEEV